jgi:hypothetical protein
MYRAYRRYRASKAMLAFWRRKARLMRTSLRKQGKEDFAKQVDFIEWCNFYALTHFAFHSCNPYQWN